MRGMGTLVGAVLLVAGCGAPATGAGAGMPDTAPTRISAYAKVLIPLAAVNDQPADLPAGVDCAGLGKYRGIKAGAPVTITDMAGHQLAKPRLESAILVGDGCEFGLTLRGLLGGRGSYIVRFPGHASLTVPEGSLRDPAPVLFFGPELRVPDPANPPEQGF